MRRLFSLIATASILATAVPAVAQTATPQDRFNAAITALNDHMGSSATPPSPSDPVIIKSVADIRSAMDAFGTPAFPVDSFNSFFTVCNAFSGVEVRFLTAGADAIPGIKDNTAESQSKLSALESQNSVTYQDVLIPLFPGHVKCIALHMPAFSAFWDSLPADQRTASRIDGLHQMQQGAAQMLSGLAVTSTQTMYTRPNRDIAINTAATYVDALADAFTVPQRKALLDQITQAAPDLATTYPAQSAALTKALSRTDCTGLCTVQ